MSVRRLTLRPSTLVEIARFELAYQARRGWPWLVFVVLAAFAFLFVRVNYVADALYADFFVNSPFLIAGATVIGGLLWLLLAPAIAGEAAARDVAARMYPLVYTAPIGKAEYLGGRFVAALVLEDIAAGGFQQLEQLVAGDQHLTLAGDTKRLQLALANVRADAGLGKLQVVRRLLYG